jgi:hypothetical protein
MRLEAGGWRLEAKGQRRDWLKVAMWAVILAALLYFGFGVYCRAGEPWDKTDLALGLGLVAARAMDFGQTRYIAQHPERFHELNPFLPKHPNEGQVATFSLATILIDAAVAHYLPDVAAGVAGWFGYELSPEAAHGLRRIYLSVKLGSSLATVCWNQSVGLKVAW